MENQDEFSNLSLAELQSLMRKNSAEMKVSCSQLEIRKPPKKPRKPEKTKSFFSTLIEVIIPNRSPKRITLPPKYIRSLGSAFSDQMSNKEQKLVPGCIVACDLAGGLIEHTGIYVGRNRVIERNGDGSIKSVSIDDFMNSSGLRTGVNLYVACAHDKIISSPAISRRARAIVGLNRNYDLINENCHRFTAYCATGVWYEITKFTTLADTLEHEFDNLTWRSARLHFSDKGTSKAI
ncbi:lecithin retinol acyltransferase family protein [Pseudomonas lundensis]|uniref:lecithin retinol acyltransferase family protein n=1 Tax=Pseudomonas lundensis TaxID=86185 RepID=UPI000ADF2047|nr:lecithin retinol acyltransferase family protein [Pseudomonas lundensis]